MPGPQRRLLRTVPEHQIDTLRFGPWVKGSVVLTDLGFYKHQGFARIEQNGYFLSRLKANADPTLIRSHLVHRGRAIDLEGSGRRSPAASSGDVLYAEVELSFQRRGYRGRRLGDTLWSRSGTRNIGCTDTVPSPTSR